MKASSVVTRVYMRWVGVTVSGAPTEGAFAIGNWVYDGSGNIYCCIGAGQPGTWVQIGGGGSDPTGASAYEVELTTTDQTEILNYTPPAPAPFQIGAYVRVEEAPTELEIEVDFTDAGGPQTDVILPPLLVAAGDYTYAMIVIASTATPIVIKATAGTANHVYVSARIS